MNYSLGNTLSRGGSLNADGLSLDLQFATDKTLTARKGPTPTFTRASTATYFAPSVINAAYTFDGDNYNVDVYQTALFNGRYRWEGGDTWLFYNGTTWELNHDGNAVATSAPTSVAWRPDLANWSGTGVTISAGSTFGIVIAAVNEPRFDHNTTAPNASRGLLIEESRTNLVFPSDTLTTQTCTVTAVAHTLSFYGTGTVVLSGVATATVTGTGAYPTRTTLTFTPTAGSLTLTVTGSVTQAQLEAGAFVTSYIPTTTASVVRSADLCSITGSDFTNFYNQSEGTIVGSGLTNQPTTNAGPVLFKSSDATNNNRVQVGMTNVTGEAVRPFIVASGTTTYSSNQGTATVGVERKVGIAYKTNDTISAFNGTLGTLDTTVTLPTNCNQVVLFSGLGNGTISSLRYFKKRLPNAKLQTFTT